MKRLLSIAMGLLVVAVVGIAQAAENPTGTWKWETNFGGKTRENTLKLKLEGDKLTGSVLGRDNQEIPIENATFKDDKVSFAVTREFNNNKFTIKYNGEVKGDTITGKSEFQRDGETRASDWVAKRQK
jgi:hypothetical protein